MKKLSMAVAILVMATLLGGCSAIAGIFKAGAIVGILAVIGVVAILIWIISLFRGKSS